MSMNYLAAACGKRRIGIGGLCTSLCASVMLLLASGCGGGYDGPQRGAVQGQVMLDGAPLAEGSISFIPAAGTTGPSAGATITAGKYSIPEDKGPAVGKYRVEIRSQQKTGKKIPAGSPFPEGTMIDETKEAVPPKYNTKSELEQDIVAGQNTIDFDLQAK